MMAYLYSSRQKFFLLLMVGVAIALSSCQKNEIDLQDPYAGGKAGLGIKFISKAPSPAIATAGDLVDINVRGLAKYQGRFKLYVNELEAEIVTLTDSTMRFKVPNDASTGGIWVTINDTEIGNQTFFGPVMQIAGNVSVDQTFAVVTGASSTIYDALRLPSGNFFLAGAFDDYESNKTETLPIGRVVQVSSLGAIDKTTKFGLAANSAVYTVARITSGEQNGKFLIGGYLSSFNSNRANRVNIYGITRLNSDGSLDSTVVDVVNPTANDVTKNRDTVPAFNGGVRNINGVRGVVVKRIFSFGDKVYVVGNFDQYVRAFYERSTYDSKIYDATSVKQIVCMKADGAMDSTFNYVVADKKGPNAGNGAVNDAIQLPDGRMVLVGAFSTFNDVTKNRIVCIKLDGTIDDSFATGSGANGEITSITYNTTTNKIAVAGNFTTFNGQAQNGVVLLNPDGTTVSGFNFAPISGGLVTFAAQTASGKLIVAGNFDRYNGVLRQGFMILNPDGNLAPNYNNTGVFLGQIYRMIETTSSSGNPAVLLVGNIYRFNNNTAKNIVKVELQN